MVRINNRYSDYVVTGQNVTLDCSTLTFPVDTFSELNWNVSKDHNNQVRRPHVPFVCVIFSKLCLTFS